MLARDRRLRRHRDINRVYLRGRYGAGGDISVKALPNHLPTTRFAIVVSKKVSGKAVVRNRNRRRLAAVLAEIQPHITPGYDIVVSVRADLEPITPTHLKDQLTGALRRSGVYDQSQSNKPKGN